MKQALLNVSRALLALGLSGCAGLSSFDPAGAPAPTPWIITVPVRAIEVVRVTPTPTPTLVPTLAPSPTPAPTPTPLPAFMAEPVNVSPALIGAVRAALAGLGEHFTLSHFTHSGSDGPVAWIVDANQPERLLCAAPLYIEGLGSVMVLSASAVFEQFARAGLVAGRQGCIVTHLERGRAQIRQMLERYQAVYAAYRSGQRFDTAGQLNAYVARFVQQRRNQPYPVEAHVVFAQLGEATGFQVTGGPARVNGSDIAHVSLVYGGPVEVLADALDQFLLSDRALKLREVAPAGSLLARQPVTPEEAVGLILAEQWPAFVLGGARAAGLDFIARGYDGALDPRNALLAPFAALTGVSALPANLSPASLQQLQDYLSGARDDAPAWIVDQYLRDLRRNVSRSYLRFEILTAP